MNRASPESQIATTRTNSCPTGSRAIVRGNRWKNSVDDPCDFEVVDDVSEPFAVAATVPG